MEIENDEEIPEEIIELTFGELKNKLLKLAQAYNTEKMRNREFETTLEWSHLALRDLPKTNRRVIELEEIHRTNAEKLLQMQTDLKKASLYSETIKK